MLVGRRRCPLFFLWITTRVFAPAPAPPVTVTLPDVAVLVLVGLRTSLDVDVGLRTLESFPALRFMNFARLAAGVFSISSLAAFLVIDVLVRTRPCRTA